MFGLGLMYFFEIVYVFIVVLYMLGGNVIVRVVRGNYLVDIIFIIIIFLNILKIVVCFEECVDEKIIRFKIFYKFKFMICVILRMFFKCLLIC